MKWRFVILLFLSMLVAFAAGAQIEGEFVADAADKSETDVNALNKSTFAADSASAQGKDQTLKKSLSLVYEVKDHLTHDAVKLRAARLLRESDSTLVDTIARTFFETPFYKGSSINVNIKQPGKYLICLEADSFKTCLVPLEIKKIHKRELYRAMPNIYMRKLPKRNEYELGEVVVKATKLKFYMDGDTLVYDADAFNLSEGSMIDALLKKLPGVTLEKGGVIKVNGRKIDAMLLNGKDFFDSNRELLLENMPAYMVNKVQSYERVPDRVKGTSMEKNAKKELVMNVKLKRNYSSGWLYNAELGGGSTFFRNDKGKLDGKFVTRLFGMHFSDNSSLVAFANVNNLSDDTQPLGQGEWTPFSQSTGLTTTYLAGVNYATEKTNAYQYRGSLDGSYRDVDESNNSNSATFLSGGDTYARSFTNRRSYEWSMTTNHSVTLEHDDNWRNLAKFVYFYFAPQFSMRKWNNHSASGSLTLDNDVSSQLGKAWVDSIMDPRGSDLLKKFAINRNVTQSKGVGHSANETLYSLLSFTPAHNDYFNFTLKLDQSLSDDKNEAFEHYRLDYPNNPAASNDFRNKYTPTVNRSNRIDIEPSVIFHLDGENVSSLFFENTTSYNYNYSNTPIYLLHKLDEWALQKDGTSTHSLGMLPSMEDMLKTLDHGNTSLSKSTKTSSNTSIGYRFNKTSGDDTFKSVEIRLQIPAEHESLNYMRGTQIDTLAHRTKVFLNPSINFFLSKFKSGLHCSFDYHMNQSAPSMVNLFNIHDDSNPLFVTLGNPDLKNTITHSLSASYGNRFGKISMNVNLGADITENAVASSFIYNKVTGVRTIKPQNVNGNWSLNASNSVQAPLIGEDELIVEHNLSYRYNHNVDIIGTELLEPTRSAVNTSNISEQLTLTWKATEKMEYGIEGKLDYQNSTSSRSDFSNINAFTYQYAAKAQIDLPWHLQLATDMTMYSRRGYSESSMNTDELVWNVRLSKKIPKSQLTIMFDGFDILGNLSNVQRYVDAQGRTETFYNVIPSYRLLHIIWRPVGKRKGI